MRNAHMYNDLTIASCAMGDALCPMEAAGLPCGTYSTLVAIREDIYQQCYTTFFDLPQAMQHHYLEETR